MKDNLRAVASGAERLFSTLTRRQFGLPTSSTVAVAVEALERPLAGLACIVPATVVLIACAEEVSPPPGGRVSVPEPTPDLAWALDTLARVGVLEGDETEQFNALTGASLLPFGHFLVVDGPGALVAAFDSAGRHLSSIESVGEGPGELHFPVAHWVTGSGEVFILDAQLSRLTRFRYGDGGFEVVDMSPVSQRVRSVCVLAGDVWLGGLMEERLAHLVPDSDGSGVSIGLPPDVEGMDELGAFGEALAYPQIVRPKVHCDERTGHLVIASLSHPRVQAYRPDGSLVWSRDMPGIVPIRFELTEDGGLRNTFDRVGGSHVLRAIVPWTDDELMMQYEIRRDDSTDEFGAPGTIDTRIVALEDGELVARTTSFPAVVGGDGNRFVLIGAGLVPRVFLVRRIEWGVM